PRATADVDVTAVVPPGQEDRVIELLLADFEPRIADAGEFAAESRTLLVFASNGCGVDVALSGFWFDADAAKRAGELEVSPGRRLPICSVEDLIVMKSVAGRPIDESDLKFLIQVERERLDVGLIRSLLKQYTAITDEDEPGRRFERFWGRYDPRTGNGKSG
ncbi:MAG: hypothetical protein ACOC8E_05650, partial [Planctomycetota bacterium]